MWHLLIYTALALAPNDPWKIDVMSRGVYNSPMACQKAYTEERLKAADIYFNTLIASDFERSRDYRLAAAGYACVPDEHYNNAFTAFRNGVQ